MIVKKLIVVVFVGLVLTVGFAIGCGKKAEPAPEQEKPAATPEAPAAGDAAAPAAPDAAAPAAPAPEPAAQ